MYAMDFDTAHLIQLLTSMFICKCQQHQQQQLDFEFISHNCIYQAMSITSLWTRQLLDYRCVNLCSLTISIWLCKWCQSMSLDRNIHLSNHSMMQTFLFYGTRSFSLPLSSSKKKRKYSVDTIDSIKKMRKKATRTSDCNQNNIQVNHWMNEFQQTNSYRRRWIKFYLLSTIMRSLYEIADVFQAHAHPNHDHPCSVWTSIYSNEK
jgi:hypothetical protein